MICFQTLARYACALCVLAAVGCGNHTSQAAADGGGDSGLVMTCPGPDGGFVMRGDGGPFPPGDGGPPPGFGDGGLPGLGSGAFDAGDLAGTPDSKCPSMTIGPMKAQGCRRTSDKKCGITLPFGCVDGSQLGMMGMGGCVPMARARTGTM